MTLLILKIVSNVDANRQQFKKSFDSINALLCRWIVQDGLQPLNMFASMLLITRLIPGSASVGFFLQAGGTLNVGGVGATEESRPNFVAPIYPYESNHGSSVPKAHQFLLAAASDTDDLNCKQTQR